MGGDNFDKSGDDENIIQEDSLLGIRKAMNQRLDFHLETFDSEVKKLSERMGVVKKIIQTLDDGNQSISIPFPDGLEPDSKVIGEYNCLMLQID